MSPLALTLELPDWLFNGTFWAGFGAGVAVVILIVVAMIVGVAATWRPF